MLYYQKIKRCPRNRDSVFAETCVKFDIFERTPRSAYQTHGNVILLG